MHGAGAGLMFLQFLASHALQLIAMAVLLAFSAFFSGTETALFNLSGGQLKRMAASSGAVERLIARLMRQPDRVLNTILFGNMLVNVAFAATSALLIHSLQQSGFPAWLIMACTVAPLIVVILMGEVTPKVLAILIGEPWARAAAPVIAGIQRLFGPVIIALTSGIIAPLTRLIAHTPPRQKEVTAEELSELLDISASHGVIDRDISGMLQEIIELTDIDVGDIMVPRVDIIGYDVDADPEGLLELFRQTRLRRMPVYENNPDAIVGIVSAKQLLLSPSVPLRQLVRPALFVPETANLEQLLVQFRQAGRQLAIVVDEYGGTAGLVSLEDVIEEIVGELPDATGEAAAPQVERISRNEYLVDGDLAIHEWSDLFHTDLQAERISTIGGFVTARLGRIPQVGDVASYQNLRFTVEAMRHRRVATLRLQLREEAQP